MFGELILFIGGFIMFTGAFGVLVLKDSYQRFHSAGKVGFVGLALWILGNEMIIYQDTGLWSWKPYLGSIVLLLSGPFACHLLARALYHREQLTKGSD